MGKVKCHLVDMYYDPQKYSIKEFAHWGNTTVFSIIKDAFACRSLNAAKRRAFSEFGFDESIGPL